MSFVLRTLLWRINDDEMDRVFGRVVVLLLVVVVVAMFNILKC